MAANEPSFNSWATGNLLINSNGNFRNPDSGDSIYIGSDDDCSYSYDDKEASLSPEKEKKQSQINKMLQRKKIRLLYQLQYFQQTITSNQNQKEELARQKSINTRNVLLL